MQAEDLLTVTFCPLPSVSAMRHGSGFQCIEIISLLLACLLACLHACMQRVWRSHPPGPKAYRPEVRVATIALLCSGA